MPRRNLLAITAVAVLSFLCIASSAQDDGTYGLFRFFVDTLNQVQREYVKDVSRDELFQGALSGIMEGLDADSSYLSPEVYRRFLQRAKENKPVADVGLHLALTPAHRQVFVLAVLPSSPAEKAGIMPGDRLLEIDAVSTRRISLEEAVQKLQGDSETPVHLKLDSPFRTESPGAVAPPTPNRAVPDDDEPAPERPAEPDRATEDGSVEITLTRQIIAPLGVVGDRRLEDGSWAYRLEGQEAFGYVRLAALTPGVAAELGRVVEQLKGEGAKALVLDLRFAAGGTVAEAVAVADLFLSKGRIVTLKGPNVAEQSWDAQEQGTVADMPLVVLVNRYTAGPAEVVAASFQDHRRAKVVGERTYGKVGLTDLIVLQDGESALRLTTKSYSRPNGQPLNRTRSAGANDPWGVRPDEGLEVGQEPLRLLGHLRSRAGVTHAASAATPNGFVDHALQRAVELLKKDTRAPSQPN